MPIRTTCKYCGKTGFVRRERVIKGGRAIESFYCGKCNRSWEVQHVASPDDRSTRRPRGKF